MSRQRVLVDTTVWIDFFQNRNAPHTARLENYLVEDSSLICICPPVVQEVLQGIREDHHYEQVLDSLMGFEMLPADPVEIAIKAAGLYRKLRKQGITIRKSNDCTIAGYAMHHDIRLLHNDHDFSLLAKHTPLRELKG